MGANLYSKEYEKTVLGIMLVDNSSIDIIRQILRREYFYFIKYGEIYDTILQIYEENQLCDISILSSKLSGSDVSAVEIATLTDDILSSANCEFYATKVKEYYFARMFKKACSESSENISGTNLNEVIGNIDGVVEKILNGQCLNKKITSQDMLDSFLDRLQNSIKLTTEYTGVDCGYPSLNEILDGLPYGELTIIGARPAMGKTSFALNLLTNVVFKKYAATFFSLEMSSDNLMQRVITAETGVSKYFIDHGVAARNMTMLNKMQRIFEKWHDADISIYDSSNCDKYLPTIQSLIRSEAKAGKKVFFIDHLGLIRYPDEKLERYKQVHEICFALHTLAQQLNICIVMLCQLRRDTEGKEPAMSDFRESGDIEQDVDNAILMHRERGQGNESSIETKLIVAKHRNGPTGVVHLDFIPASTKFIEQKKDRI
jgi:replicative DNA helicase